MHNQGLNYGEKSAKFHTPDQTSLEWNSAKNGPLERSTVLHHFSPVGSDGTSYRVTSLIFCFKSQAKPVGLTQEKVKLAQAWYSTATRSSPGRIQNSSAGSQKHCSQPVTPVLHPTPLLLKPFTVSTASKLTGKSAIISRSSTQRNQNPSVFSSTSKQKENHQKKGNVSFLFPSVSAVTTQTQRKGSQP